MLRAILVDDEIAAIRSLELLLKECCPDVKIIGTARSGEEALKLLTKENPDIVFLDIEMPHGSGFDLLENLSNFNFEIIFVTAYNHYAVKAFKYSAVDYILKPIDIDELAKAVEKVRILRSSKVNSRARYTALFENLKGIVPHKLVIPQGATFQTVNLAQVVQANIKQSALTFIMEDCLEISCPTCKNDINDLLVEKGFLQINSNCFINLGKVSRVEKSGKGSVIMSNGNKVNLDFISKDDFIDQLTKYNEFKKA